MIIAILCLLALLSFGVVFFLGCKTVPHSEIWIVERLGKFHRRLEPGLNWLIPFIDAVVDHHSLKEEAIEVPAQTAITQDNVSVSLDGIVYVRIVDPVAASYGAKDPMLALTQLVQTTMRSEIGKIPLDKTFEERESLNAQIVEAINVAAASWGISCLRYEIKDITMPEDIRKAMELQMTAERQKRARILESEGIRQAKINESEGQRQAEINLAEGSQQRTFLESEAALVEQINQAKGAAEMLRILTLALEGGGERAAALLIAEKHIEALKALAKEGTTLLLPAALDRPATMISESLAIYETVGKKIKTLSGQTSTV